MLKNLTLSGLECFGNAPLPIDDLRAATFIFGANGSGKTSISRSLAQSTRERWDRQTWRGDRSGDVLVYNKDFADRFLDSHIKGVFLMGEESQELHEELDALKGPRGARAEAVRRRDGCATNLDRANAELAAARATFESEAWRHKPEIPVQLQPAFKGSNAAKKVFAKRLLGEYQPLSEQASTVDELVLEAESIFDTSAVEESRILTITPVDIFAIPSYELLDTRIVGRSDARLSDLVERLKNADWVSQGRGFLEHSDGLCPFCQQRAPEDLAEALEEMFDRNYDQQKLDLVRFVETIRRRIQETLSRCEQLAAGSNKFVDQEKFTIAAGELERVVLTVERQLDEKLKSPSSLVKLPDLSSPLEAVNEVIREANVAIDAHNHRVRDRGLQRPLLEKKCWQYFGSTYAERDLAVYGTEKQRLEPKIAGLGRSLDKTDEELKDIDAKIQALEARMVSSSHAINRINQLLLNTGFSSFKLQPSEGVKDGYTMVREGGVVERGSLSEGERTFLTFLYFYHLVEDTKVEDTTRPLVVVIDDPISSMDSDVMLVVSVLVKALIARTQEDGSRVSQVIVLTHNVHFHKEVTYRWDRSADGKRIFYIIRKFNDAPHRLNSYEKNPIQSAYGRLWGEVRDAQDNPQIHSPVGLENIMRRILETYFHVLGDVGQHDITSRFSGDDMLVCRSLYLWAHGGSHSLFDDNDFSPTTSSTDMYLRVFREIFEKTDQIQHYRMMMQTPESSSLTG